MDDGVQAPCGPVTVAPEANPEPFRVTDVLVELTVCADVERANRHSSVIAKTFIWKAPKLAASLIL